jgi:hypothetical protein
MEFREDIPQKGLPSPQKLQAIKNNQVNRVLSVTFKIFHISEILKLSTIQIL